MEQEILLKMSGVTKVFPGVKALDDVNIDVRRGEVHAIVGENGAGKSTLIKVISGVHKCDAGTYEFDGEKITDANPRMTLDKGISVIYQELTYLPTLSIAENIFTGSQQKTAAKLIDYKTMYAKSLEVQKLVGLDHYSPKTEVSRLSTAEKQLIEIARAQARKLKLLILDEPTSALNDKEIERLFGIINHLKEQGCGIIYITHKMDEIFRIADRVSVIRDGKHILTEDMDKITRDEIITAMVGRELKNMYPVTERQLGETVLEVEHLNSGILKDVSFNARRGEILGLYGLMGCGNDRAMECVFGKVPIESGTVKLNGKVINIHGPKDAIKNKIAYAPGERKTEGVMLIQPVRANISVVTLGKMKKAGLLDLKKEKVIAKKWVERLRIKTPSVETMAESLSGGNQQKLVLAKWMEDEPQIFLMNEPTKGIDVGAKAEIYEQMEQICEAGATVIFVTSDLPELLNLSDRVFVFHEGVVTGEISRAELTQENVAKKAIGE